MLSIPTCDALDFNVRPIQNPSLLPRYDTRQLGSTICPNPKRAKINHPDDFAKGPSWARFARTDVLGTVNPAAPTFFTPLRANGRLPPRCFTQSRSDEDVFGQEQSFSPSLTAAFNQSKGDMTGSRSARRDLDLSSKEGKNKSIGSLILKDIRPTNLGVSRSKNDVTGVYSRRQPVLSENPPWLAASGYKTTSSKIHDNLINRKSQLEQNGNASAYNISVSNATTAGRAGEVDIATESNSLEAELQIPYFGSYLPQYYTGNFHAINETAAIDVLGSSGARSDASANSGSTFPLWPESTSSNLESPDWSSLNLTLVHSENNLASIPSDQNFPQSNLMWSPPQLFARETDNRNSNHAKSLEVVVRESPNVVHMDYQEGSFGHGKDLTGVAQTSTDSNYIDASIANESMDMEYSANDETFNAPDNYDSLTAGSPHLTFSDSDYVLVEHSNPYSPSTFCEEESVPENIKKLHFSHSGGSTGMLPKNFPFRRRRNKEQQRQATMKGFHHGNFDSPSLSSGLSEVNIEDPLSGSLGMSPQAKTDHQPSSTMWRTLDVGETVSSIAYSPHTSLSESSTTGTIISDLGCRKEIVRDHPDSTHFQSSSHIVTKFSKLKDTTNIHSPVLVLSEMTNETQKTVQDILAKANQQSPSKKAKSSSSSPPRKIATTWEHTFVVQGGFTDAAREPQLEHSQSRSARRRGPLRDGKRERALEMRKIGSCLRCRKSKIACTKDEICAPCEKVISSPFTGRVCVRNHLKDFANLFLPEPAVRPFQKASIDRLMKEKVSGFSENQFKVSVTSGPFYTPMELNVHAFHTPDESFLAFKKIVKDDLTNAPIFSKTCYSPPLGIKDFSQDLRGKLIHHISNIIKGRRNEGEVSSGTMSRLTWDVYEAVRHYQAMNPENLFLRNVLMLHAMQVLMTKSIMILEDSSEIVLDNLSRPYQFDYTHNPNVRLVNIQIKHVMCSLIKQTYFDVLDELERILRPKEPRLWAPTFCGIVILCMCAELVQTTTDLRVVNALDDKAQSASGLDWNGNSPSRDDSIDTCRRLDELPIASAINTFHWVSKNNKTRGGSKKDNSFNPIRDGVDTVRSAYLGQDVEDLVTRIRTVVKEHDNELKTRISIFSFNSSPDVVADHAIFRKRNSGRLVSAFLRSLL